MIAQPQSFRCTLLIEHIEPDPNTPHKFSFSGKILRAEDAAGNNSFYQQERSIKGFAFNLSPEVKDGSVVEADVGFMGDPFVQNYELSNVSITA